MALDKRDIDVLKTLVKKEIKEFEKEGSGILRAGVVFLSTEEKYDIYLKELLKKLK